MMYLYFVPLTEKGVLKKILFQKKALKKIDIDLKELEIINNNYYFNSKKIGKFFEKNDIKSKILRKIELITYMKNLKNKELYKNIKIIYIRNFGATPWSIFYFKFLKSIDLKIILEIPTYPYDKECNNLNIFFLLDKICRMYLYKYVDKIVTYSEDKYIWKIPCINIGNGIDLDLIKLKNKKENLNKITFTSISNCSFWHGIDRFLKSLEKYGKLKNKKEVIFNIIGEGIELNKIKKIVSKSEYLKKIVIFHGFLSGENLDEIYDLTDIGVGSLGIHRLGLKQVQPLKNREYTAKGIPFIISFKDPDFEDALYVYKVKEDDTLIDISKIIEWYESNNFSCEKIREDAKKFSWDIQMKKVIDNI